MDNANPTPDPHVKAEGRYAFFRSLARLWLGLGSHKVRLLGEGIPGRGAALLFVCHPPSLLAALVLVAAFDRKVRCLVPCDLLVGRWRGWLARQLSMIPFDPAPTGWAVALASARELLASSDVVALFADFRTAAAGGPGGPVQSAARLAIETESRHPGRLGLVALPVHVFLPMGDMVGREVLIHVKSPVSPREHLAAAGSPQAANQATAVALETALAQNAFGLPPDNLREFSGDLGEVLRADLEEEWATKPNWRQKVEGFTLSRFISDWLEQANCLDPGRLVALREELERYREARRRCSLKELEVEAAADWLKRPLLRAWYWLESALGFPVGLYGLLNHLLAWLVLFWAGLLASKGDADRRLLWAKRALVVAACYAVQVLICAHWLGRAAAGYYALTLPFSGAYLWRYEWLLRNRTRLLAIAVGLPRAAARLRQRRKRLLEQLDVVRDEQAEAMGIPL